MENNDENEQINTLVKTEGYYLDSEGRQNVPFQTKRLEEERSNDKGVVFSMRLNDEEYERLRQAKDWFDTDQNSTAMKILVDVGFNVLQGQFSKGVLDWLFKKDRVRSSDLRGRR